MADKTGISWTDATWNPIRGCSKVSAGCKNCYAEKVAARFSGPGAPYEGTTSNGRWNGNVRLVSGMMAQPLKWKRPRRIFVNSMSDLFHEGVPFEYIAAVFGVMAACPQHTFQVLTKRPARAEEFFAWLGKSASPPIPTCAWIARADLLAERARRCEDIRGPTPLDAAAEGDDLTWPLPNVHLGVSVEDQQTADERIPSLLFCPAAVRFVSYEPALGPVDFTPWLPDSPDGAPGIEINGQMCDPRSLDSLLSCMEGGPVEATGIVGTKLVVDWIIVGGESGPGARPFDVAWARSTIEQCKAAGVACFVKQMGTNIKTRPGEWDAVFPTSNCSGADPAEWPEDLRVQEFPEVTT